jgi:hypothetical protein
MTKSIRLLSVWAVLLAMTAASALYAQPPVKERQRAAKEQVSPQALLREMEQIQQELLQTQETALANNPKLREQAETLQSTMLEAMRAEGFEPVESLARLEQLEQRLQSEGANSSSRPALVEELHSEQQRLIQAEEAALQRQEVQQARDQFLEGLLQAMRAENPQTDELMVSLKQKNAQLQEMISAQSE